MTKEQIELIETELQGYSRGFNMGLEYTHAEVTDEAGEFLTNIRDISAALREVELLLDVKDTNEDVALLYKMKMCEIKHLAQRTKSTSFFTTRGVVFPEM